MTPLEETLSTELFSKDVELDLLPAGIFILFLSSLVYSGEWGTSHCLAPCIMLFHLKMGVLAFNFNCLPLVYPRKKCIFHPWSIYILLVIECPAKTLLLKRYNHEMDFFLLLFHGHCSSHHCHSL